MMNEIDFSKDIFTKEKGKTCKKGTMHSIKSKKVLETLEDAKDACLSDSKCDKVLDSYCDERKPFIFCTSSPSEDPEGQDISPCLYSKNRHNGKKQKWAKTF